MIKIGITGSISSGKSTVAKLLSKGRHPVFNADRAVANLYKRRDFIKKIKRKFNIKNSKNIKKEIKNLVKQDKKNIRKLELIIHPLVRKKMKRYAMRVQKLRVKMTVMYVILVLSILQTLILLRNSVRSLGLRVSSLYVDLSGRNYLTKKWKK